MTPHKWDLHKRTYCATCAYGPGKHKRCPVIPIMDKNTNDRQCQDFFQSGRDGHCTQYAFTTTRKSGGKRRDQWNRSR